MRHAPRAWGLHGTQLATARAINKKGRHGVSSSYLLLATLLLFASSLPQSLRAQDDPYNPIPHHGWMESYVDSSIAGDSIPYVIVTSEELKPVFEDFARWKRMKGTPTEVISTAEILASYDGDSLQIQIRNYLRTRFVNNHTKWLLIGGDFHHVPVMYFYTGSTYFYGVFSAFTDYYYACLDYDWNEDGDEYFGEGFFDGDTLDAYAELYIGRIPARDSFEARILIDKLYQYETDPTHRNHQTRALLTSSDVSFAGDDAFNQTVSAQLPDRIVQTRFHQAIAADVEAALLEGHGLIVNACHSQNAYSFLTRYGAFVPEGSSPIYYDFFDTTSTHGVYSVWLNSTCHYGSIEHDTTIARSFLFNPDGWGVGYFGPSETDRAMSADYYKLVIEYLYDSTVTEIGKAISLARDAFQVFPLWPSTHFDRYSALAQHYFGDPQMNFFTEEPQDLEIVSVTSQLRCCSDLASDIEIQVSSSGLAAESVLVCLSIDTLLYLTAYTDADGIASFTDFNSNGIPGNLTIVASKPNHFTATMESALAVNDSYEPENAGVLPRTVAFEQNYPNPFNPSTTLRFSLPRREQVRLEVFNLLGKRVCTVANRSYTAGEHSLTWNGTDDSGNALAAGVYFARLSTNDFSAVRKLLLLR